MIVRAGQPLMRGARLTPLRNYTGPTRGLTLVRPGTRTRHGLGSPSDTLALASANVQRDLQSDISGLAFAVEQGQVVPPATVLQGFQDRVNTVCTDVLNPGDACDPSQLASVVQAAYQQYLSALAAQQAKTAAEVAAGSIAVPAGYSGGSDLYSSSYTAPTVAQANATLASITGTPAAPATAASAPVISTRVQSNAPGSAVAVIPRSRPGAPTIVSQAAPAPASVQSNAPAAAVVVPGVVAASNWSGLLTQSTILPSIGIPDSVLVLGVIGVAWLMFSGKR